MTTRLTQRLADGDVILIDGGTGTEVERRGVEMTNGVWSGVAALTHPDVIQAVHEDYIRCGAELIIANSYASSKHLLEREGFGDQFEHLNRLSVRLALDARRTTGATDVAVAGSISTTEMGGVQPPLETARANYLEQARLQADAGAELIVLEMLREIPHSQVALDAVFSTGLPVWAGYSCKMKDGEPYLFSRDTTLAEGLRAIAGQPIELVAIMHTDLADIDACLDVVDAHWDGPVGVYAQMGDFDGLNWQFEDQATPETHSEMCLGWIDRGVQVVGGCCGIGVEHIAHLRAALDQRQVGTVG